MKLSYDELQARKKIYKNLNLNSLDGFFTSSSKKFRRYNKPMMLYLLLN
jgi:hypothetical protein